jgi:hypothetical protein
MGIDPSNLPFPGGEIEKHCPRIWGGKPNKSFPSLLRLTLRAQNFHDVVDRTGFQNLACFLKTVTNEPIFELFGTYVQHVQATTPLNLRADLSCLVLKGLYTVENRHIASLADWQLSENVQTSMPAP